MLYHFNKKGCDSMTTKVTRLFPAPPDPNGLTCIATVAEVINGEALSVLLPGEALPQRVSGHFSAVPMLKPGDRVAVMQTADGPVVMSRLRAPGEIPQPLVLNEEGRLTVDAPGGICLTSGDSRIEITADGRIWVDGKEIYSISSGRMRLQGSTIELN